MLALERLENWRRGMQEKAAHVLSLEPNKDGRDEGIEPGRREDAQVPIAQAGTPQDSKFSVMADNSELGSPQAPDGWQVEAIAESGANLEAESREARWNADVERVRALLAARALEARPSLGTEPDSTKLLAHRRAHKHSAPQGRAVSAAAVRPDECKYLPVCSGIERVMREAQVL